MIPELNKCPCCGQLAPSSGTVTFDTTAGRIFFNGHSTKLTRRLVQLALILAEQMPGCVAHETLTAKMWGDAEIDVDGNLKVAACQLRAKVRHLGLTVTNLWGTGYALEELPAVSRTEILKPMEQVYAQA